MHVECFSGLMGGGKSFWSLITAALHISKGGVVFTNILFHLDAWFNDAYAHVMKSFWLTECFDGCRVEMHKGGIVLPVMRRTADGVPEFEYNSHGFRYFLAKRYKWELQPGQYHYIPDSDVNADLPSRLPPGSQRRALLVILDEALDHFESNGTGTSNATAEFRSFLRHIRKLGIHLVFIAQDFGSMDKKIRMLTHYVWRFRDLYSWPVPIFNRPLPSPWKDHIICEQFHRSHFGKAKSITVNKDTWIARDPLVFQSYQSISLHNSGIKMAEDIQVDFGDVGKIVKKREKKMNWLERAALILCLVLAGMGAFKKVPAPVVIAADPQRSNDSDVVAVVVEDRPDPVTVVTYGRFQYSNMYRRDGLKLYINGIEYKLGQMTNAGTVLSVTENSVHIRDDEGNDTFIYPSRFHLMPNMPGTTAEPATAQAAQASGDGAGFSG